MKLTFELCGTFSLFSQHTSTDVQRLSSFSTVCRREHLAPPTIWILLPCKCVTRRGFQNHVEGEKEHWLWVHRGESLYGWPFTMSCGGFLLLLNITSIIQKYSKFIKANVKFVWNVKRCFFANLKGAKEIQP